MLNLKELIQTLIIFLIIDVTWLGYIANSFYMNQLKIINNVSSIDENKLNYFTAAGAYLLMAIGFELFVHPQLIKSNSFKENLYNSLKVGGMFGLVLYGVYDLTNYSTINRWTVEFVVVDMIWGFIVYTLAALITNYIK